MRLFRRVYRFFVLWLVDGISLWVTAEILPGIAIQPGEGASKIGIAAAAALLLGVINFLIRPLILLLAVPFGFILVFVVGFLVNAIVLLILSDLLAPGFQVDGLLPALVGSLIFSVINTILTELMTLDDEDSVYQGLIERLARRRMYTGGVPDERGVVMLEIDGLSYHHISKAIADGWMPHVRDMIEDRGYQLSRIDCGLPSQTSACQSGIMFGNNYDIPAFRWFDKDRNKLMVSGNDAPEINARYSDGNGLMRGGTSINNMMNGDAQNSLLTLADLRTGDAEDKKQRARDIYLLMLNPYFFTRTLVFFFADVIVELWEGWNQKRQNVEPRLNRLHRGYPFIRAATTVFMREISSKLALLEIIRGTPSLYLTWPGYDEVAHHSGPWTKDAFGTLRHFDRVIGQIQATIKEKAPRPYELVLLSDHGQSFGHTFLMRYGFTLKEFIEQNLPSGTEVIHVAGGDDGTIGMRAMAGELDNMQQQGMAGSLGGAVAGQTAKLLERGAGMQTVEVEAEASSAATVTVCGSGNLAQIYFDLYPRKIRLGEFEEAFPGMVDALVGHEGIGFLVGYDDADTPLVLGKTGRRNLHNGEVTGDDPLSPYGDVELRALQVRRIADFPHAGDLIANSTFYPDGTVAAMEELIGNHGGLGGEQTDAFILHPADMQVGATNNSADVFAILNSRRGLIGEPLAVARAAAAAEEVSAWSPRTLAAGLVRVGAWLGHAGRALVLDRRAYREVSQDPYMTGPALLLGVLGAIVASWIRAEGFNPVDALTRFGIWFVGILVLFAAGRILGGKASYTATLRAVGFAQVVQLL
ncbi:MAG TPA: phage holin family protein, partial [Anaerolineales bacterium]|nr:phage holin family protein [Anaerolineales bacterium]